MQAVTSQQPHDGIIDAVPSRTQHARERLDLRAIAAHDRGVALVERPPITCGDCGQLFPPRHRRQMQRLDEGTAVGCSRDCARCVSIRADHHRRASNLPHGDPTP